MSPRRRRRVGRWLLRLLVLLTVAWLAWEAWTWPDVAALARRTPADDRVHRALPRPASARPDATTRASGSGCPTRRSRPTSSGRCWSPRTSTSSPTAASTTARSRRRSRTPARRRRCPRGASTITQQLAKNLWLSPSRNPLRKVKEAILTWQLERTLAQAPHPRALPERRRVRPGRLRRRGRRAAATSASPPPSLDRATRRPSSPPACRARDLASGLRAARRIDATSTPCDGGWTGPSF